MSACSTSVFDAVAFQLLEALSHYEEDCATMLGAWPGPERCRSSSEHIDRIRVSSSALPELRAHCIELLIAHAELVHFLWRAQQGERHVPADSMDAVRVRHQQAVAMLRERCVQLVAGPAPKPAGTSLPAR